MTREGLIKKVALKIDEISSSDDSMVVAVGPEDNNPLYAQINCLLNESVNEVLMKAPTHRLQSQAATVWWKVSLTEKPTLEVKMEHIFGRKRTKAVITVPDDFLRLISISSDLTERPIVDLSLEGENVAKKQHNKFLVAKNEKPVGVLKTNEGMRTVEFYSFGQGELPVITMTYIKRYDDADIITDDYLIDIITWVCAGKVLFSRGDIERAKSCDENAAALMI
jgi:hypothetical protein